MLLEQFKTSFPFRAKASLLFFKDSEQLAIISSPTSLISFHQGSLETYDSSKRWVLFIADQRMYPYYFLSTYKYLEDSG